MLVPVSKSTLHIPLLIKNESGTPVNADAMPTILNVQKNGVDATEGAVTVIQAQDDTPAIITGSYIIVCDLSPTGLNAAANDDFIVTVSATVGGTTLTDTESFVVADLKGNQPSISIA